MTDSSHKKILAEIRARMAEIEQGSSSLQSISYASPVTSTAIDEKAPEHVQAEGLADNVSPKRSSSQTALDERAAMRKIERLCLMREQASKQLLQRLVKDGFSEDVAACAVDRAVRCGLVDDMRFAGVLVRCRVAAGKGRAGIERELASLDIDPYSVDEFVALLQQGDSSELERAVSLLEKKPPRAKNAREAAFRRLCSKGFSSDIASRAARLWIEGSTSDVR